jgi:chromosome partitioning protein
MRTIAIAGQKSRSGKTTTARCLGAVLAKEYEQSVLLVDVDPQADLSTSCDVEGEGASLAEVLNGNVLVTDVLVKIAPRLQLLPSDIALAQAELSFFRKDQAAPAPMENELKSVLQTVADEFDIALLDLPPSLSLLTVYGLVAAQEVLIPARPEFIDLRALALLVETLNSLQQGRNSILMNPDLVVAGILPTFYNSKLRHHKEIIAAWKATGMPLLDVYVMDSPQHVKALLARKPITNYDPENPIIQAYQRAVDIMIQGLGTVDWE